MPKVILTQDYDYHPSKEPRICKAYKASKKAQSVNEECAARVVEAGIGTLVAERKLVK